MPPDRLGSGAGDLLGGGFGAVVAWSVLIVCAGLVVLLVVVVARNVPRQPERDEPTLRVEVRRGSADWTAEAERLEAAGEWKAALRCRYRALTAELVARRVVRDLPGRTTGEYRADVATTAPDARTDFGAASELFERAWYGARPTGADESARFREHAEHVLARADRADRADRDLVSS